jgi:hypothetical protein
MEAPQQGMRHGRKPYPSYPEFDAALRRKTSITLDHAVLHFDGAAHRIHDASELDEDAIAGSLDALAVHRCDEACCGAHHLGRVLRLPKDTQFG